MEALKIKGPKRRLTPEIRMGLENIKILRHQLEEAESDLHRLDVYQRLFIMMSSVIHDMLKLFGDRSGHDRRKSGVRPMQRDRRKS